MNPTLSTNRFASRRKSWVKLRTVAIVPAAGCGRRLGLKKLSKPFVLLGGKPLIIRTLSNISSSGLIEKIVVAVEKDSIQRLKAIIKKYRVKKICDIVAGSSTRYGSVKNCLKRIGPGFDIVLIHDGARPFVDKRLIEGSINLARKFGACIAAVPESDTVKAANDRLFIVKTLDRNRVFRAQTPQAFRCDLIKRAYAIKGKGQVTDDASLVERLGKKVKILEGSYRNLKITTKEDLKLAEVLL